MKPQSLIMLVVAAACGLAAMVLTQRFLSAPTDKKLDDLTPVVVANIEIQQGTTLNETMLKEVDYPKAFVPAGAVTDMKSIVGRATRYHLGASEVLTDAKLAPEGVSAGLETVIEEGKRAITVGINTDRSVAGFIKPNSHVDVMLVMRSQGPEKPALSKTILQDIKVLAVNTDMQNNGDPDNRGKTVEMVTFLVTPEEAEKLSLAQENGVLALRLRSSVDREAVATKKVTLDEVLSDAPIEEDEKSIDPDRVFLDKEKLGERGRQSALGGLIAGLIGRRNQPKEEGKKESPQLVAQAPIAPPAPVPPVPQKTLKRLVYRDLQGKPLMEVLVDAESKIAANLQHMLEEVETGKVEDPARRAGGSTDPETPLAEEPEPADQTEPTEPDEG